MIIHSPIFSGSVTQAESATVNLSGSFTGSFKGVGDFTGLVADSVPYEDVTDKPTLVSGSSQVSYPELSNIPSGIVSSSAQLSEIFLETLGDGVFSGSSQVEFNQVNNNPFSQSASSVNVSKSIIPTSFAIDLGSVDVPFRDLYLSSASLYINGQEVISSTAGDLTITTKANQSLRIIEEGVDTITLQSENGDITLVANGTGTIELNAPIRVQAGKQILSSDGNAIVFGEDISVTGNIAVTGEVDGVDVSSLKSSFDTLNGKTLVSGSSQVVYTSLSSIPSGIVSGSSQVVYTSLSSIPAGIVSGSSQVDADTITNFDTNVKAKLDTDLVVSGSTSDVKTFLSLQNVTNESKATMFASPTFTGTVSGVAATHVGLGNVTNESKATMFTSPTFTGTVVAPTPSVNDSSTKVATTAYVQQELTDLIGGASEAFDTLGEISASLAADSGALDSLVTVVSGKLSKTSNLSDLTDTSTARTNLGVAIGTNVQAFNSTLASVAGGTYSGDDSITLIGTVTTGSVTAILPTGVVSGSAQVTGLSNAQLTNSSITIGSTSTALGATSTTLAGLTSVSSTGFTGALTGNASTATTLQTARTIGGVSFNGSANINLPGVNTAGNQNTSGNAATVTTNANLTGDVTSVGNATTIGAAKVTNAMLAGSIANNKLTNSTISGIALGSNLATLTIGTGLSGTSYNGSAEVTIANTGVTSNVAGTGVSVSGATGAVTISIGQAVATSSNVQFNSIGIGMAASATAGRIDATNDVVAFSSSDIRFKENITPIENALDKISKINGYTYDWKEENKIEHGYDGNDVGVIAQEIEEILPQLVQTRESGFKAVKYDKLVALLIAGMKEQQLQIEELKSRLS